MVYCVAAKCKNSHGKDYWKKRFSFHHFPLQNPDICDIWTRNCGRVKGWKPSRHSCLCSEHFSKDCYEEDMYLKIMGKPRSSRCRPLKPGTLPTLFQHEATVQTRYECASGSLTERKLQPKEEKQPNQTQPYNVLALQPMMTDMETLLPSTYTVAPEFIANVDRNPIETTEDPELKGDPTNGQFTGNRDAPACCPKTEDKYTAKTFIGRDVNAAERFLQTVPGAVEVRLVVKPDDHLVTLQSKLGSILHAEVVENDQYYLDLIDDRQVKLHRLQKNTIKKEKSDPEYDQARPKNSHPHGDLNNLEERSEVRSTASDFNPVQTLSSTPYVSNTVTQSQHDARIRHCRSLNLSRWISPNSVDYRFVLPVSNQSQMNYAAGISGNSDVVRCSAPVVNQNVINPDVCHTAGLSQYLIEPCNSREVNSELCQTSAGDISGNNSAEPCNSQFLSPVLHQSSAKDIPDTAAEEQLGVPASSPSSQTFIYTSGPVDITTEKQFQESQIIPGLKQTSNSTNVYLDPCDSLFVDPEAECFTSTTGKSWRGDTFKAIARFTVVPSELVQATSSTPEQCAQPVMIPSVDQTLNTTSGLPEQCSTSTFISGSEQTMHSEINHSDKYDHGAQHPDLLLEADNIDSITGLPQTAMGTDEYFNYTLQAKQLLEHSYSFETRRFRLGYLNTKENKLAPWPTKKHRGKSIADKKTVSRSHITPRDPSVHQEGTLEGEVETHFECEYCDFATSDWDQFARHMKESHQINMGDRNPRPSSPSCDVDDDESQSADTSTEDMESIAEELVDQETEQLNEVVNINPNDLIEKETDNERDVYKCKECSYTFSREGAALSPVKIQHVNKEAALYYDKTSEKDVKRKSHRCSQSNDESFSLSECSVSPESDEDIESDEEELQTKDNNSKFAKTIEDSGTEWPKNRICDLCGEICSFLSKQNRNRHRSKSQKEADREYSRNYGRKSRLESGPLPCPKHGCDKMFTSRQALSAHNGRVHGPTFKCDICWKLYSNKPSLLTHKDAVHRRIRKYCCTWPDCDKVFSGAWHRKVHMRIHTNEKPLQCELCGFRARQSNSLRYHFKKHHKAKSPSYDDSP